MNTTELPAQPANWDQAPEWAECWGLYMGEWCWFSDTDPWGVQYKEYRPANDHAKSPILLDQQKS